MGRPRKAINVTWLGEDQSHADGDGPQVNVWNGIEFRKGESVPISDPRMIAKAKGNQFFSVDSDG